MSILGVLTDEYFGKIMREEELMRPPKKDSKRPTRDLTTDEMEFLSALAKYTMFFDRSLFFQIEDLRRHTELVLSGERIMRSEFSHPTEWEREIQELKQLIKKLGQEDWDLKRLLEERLKDLEDALDKKKYGPYTTMLLGEYKHNNGNDSEVILYVNNIEKIAEKNPAKTMYLMGQVLLHEYFHSFYYHVGVGNRKRISCIEEPMAEYGSLVVLDSVKSSGLPHVLKENADKALNYTYEFVKRKQDCIGTTAAYGFGAYIFDKHKDDFYDLISGYANMSRLLNDSNIKVRTYKYLVYPKYSSPLEEYAYELLRDIIFSREHGRSTKVGVPVSSTTGPKVGLLARTEFTRRIPTFPSDMLDNLQNKDYCKTEFGLDFPVLSRTRVKTSGKFRYYAVSVDDYYICSEWYERRHREKLEDWLSRH